MAAKITKQPAAKALMPWTSLKSTKNSFFQKIWLNIAMETELNKTYFLTMCQFILFPIKKFQTTDLSFKFP